MPRLLSQPVSRPSNPLPPAQIAPLLPPLSRTRNNSSGGLVVEIGIPKTIYDLNNCTLAPSPSGRALNLTHTFATSKVNGD